MRELLTNMDLLREPVLDLETLQLDGIRFGSTTAQFPRHKITEVSFSPIVAKSVSRRDGTQYFDQSGQQLSLESVIDSVIDTAGVVHFTSRISFRIRAARVVCFSIYGAQLRYFDFLRTYRDFCDAFGVPDRVAEIVGYDGLMAYRHTYFGARKIVVWDEYDLQVSCVALGEGYGTASTTETSGAD